MKNYKSVVVLFENAVHFSPKSYFVFYIFVRLLLSVKINLTHPEIHTVKYFNIYDVFYEVLIRTESLQTIQETKELVVLLFIFGTIVRDYLAPKLDLVDSLKKEHCA